MSQARLLEPEDHSLQNQEHIPLLIADKHPKNAQKRPQMPYSALLSYISQEDKILMMIGSISSIIKGATIPYLLLLLGQMFDAYYDPESTKAAKIINRLYPLSIIYFVALILAPLCWRKLGEKQATEIYKRYLSSLLGQDLASLELQKDQKKEFKKIQICIGSDLPTIVQNIAIALTGVIIAHVQGFMLAFLLTGVSVVSHWVSFEVSQQGKKYKEANNIAENRANKIAEEILSKARTVILFGNQENEKKLFKAALKAGENDRTKLTLFSVISRELGSLGGLLLCLLGFYGGSMMISPLHEITKDSFTGGKMLTVISCILIAGSSLKQAFLKLESLNAAVKTFAIERKRQISNDDDVGVQLNYIEGYIEFKDVRFAYPFKPDQTVLDGATFKIRRNETVALVGDSNCGKTACIDLLQRLYDLTDQDNGSITLDGHEIRDLSRKLLRENIGYIGREPGLLGSNIRENLLMAKEDASDSELWEALEEVCPSELIHSLADNVDKLPECSKGLNYLVAIAQVVLKNPKILVIEEPICYSDELNKTIRDAIYKISRRRTTIVLGHTLETLKNIDRIIVLDEGKIAEEGKYQDLMGQQGKFSNLVELKAEMKPTNFSNRDRVVKRKRVVESQAEHYRREKSYENGLDCLGLCAVIISMFADYKLLSMGYVMFNFLQAILFPQTNNLRDQTDPLAREFLTLAVICSVLRVVEDLIINLHGDQASSKLKSDLFEKYLSMPLEWFDKPECSSKALVKQLTKEISLFRSLTVVSPQLAKLFFLALVFVFLFYADVFPPLFISLFVLLAEYARFRLYKGSSLEKSVYKESENFANKVINNLKAVTFLMKPEKLEENYCGKLRESQKSSEGTVNLYVGAIAISFAIFCYLFSYTCGFRSHDGVPTFQEFMDLLQLLLLVVFILYRAVDWFPFDLSIQDNSVVSDLLKFVYAPTAETALNNNNDANNRMYEITGNIEFLNVSFKLDNSESFVLQNLSLKIEASSKVALLGLSEEEKSAFSMLLQGFSNPTQGYVSLDGVSPKDYEFKYLRNSIGVISKEPVLFSGTIAKNIKYGQENMSFDEIKSAAQKANALDFIENNEFEFISPNDARGEGFGFERLIGSKGGQLSKSQAQRIAIARAIRKDPAVLIIDDFTSGLDAENERLVREPVDRMMEGKTCLIFANKVSQIKKANEIVVFREGQLVEKGSYDVLAAKFQGVFSQLEKDIALEI